LKYRLVYTQRAVKDIQRLEEKIKNGSQRPFYDIQRILSNTQKNLLIQGWEEGCKNASETSCGILWPQ
jgi:hypothetical protein